MHLILVMKNEQSLKKDFSLFQKYTTGKEIYFLSLDLAHFVNLR